MAFRFRRTVSIFPGVRLKDIDWPQETELSFKLTEDGKTLMLDVDLPEIEDFPNTATGGFENKYLYSVKLGGGSILTIWKR